MSYSRNINSRADSKRPPLILISPSVEVKGAEFGDMSISLSETYQAAVMAAGGVPLILPGIASTELVAECVGRCDGVLLTGGDDIDPKLYSQRLSAQLAKTVTLAGGGRLGGRNLMLHDHGIASSPFSVSETSHWFAWRCPKLRPRPCMR